MSRENDGPWKMYLLSKNGCVGYLKRDHFSRNTSEPTIDFQGRFVSFQGSILPLEEYR